MAADKQSHVDAIQKLIDDYRIAAAVRIANKGVETVYVSSPILVKASNRMLVGTGATGGLLIANLDKLQPVIGSTHLHASILLLVASMLCGALAHIRATSIEVRRAYSEVQDDVGTVFEEFVKLVAPLNEPHFPAEIRAKINASPPSSAEVAKAFEKGLPLVGRVRLAIDRALGEGRGTYAQRMSADTTWQGMYTSSQLALAVAFLVTIAAGLNT